MDSTKAQLAIFKGFQNFKLRKTKSGVAEYTRYKRKTEFPANITNNLFPSQAKIRPPAQIY